MKKSFVNKKDQLIRKTKCKEVIFKYLTELNLICNMKITKNDLLPLEETDKIIEQYKPLYPNRKEIFNFENKNTLQHIFNNISNLNKPVYLFTVYSRLCGAVKLNNTDLFNVYFNFDDEHAGIITIYSYDFKSKIVLDFYKDGNIKLLEVEIEGYWSKFYINDN